MKLMTIVSTLLVAAVVALTSVEARAAEEGSHSSKMQSARPLKTVKDAQGVQPGDTVVACCPHCKTVSYSVVELDKGAQASSKPWLKNAKGKNPEDQLGMTCEKCGEEMFCCVITKNEPGRKQPQ